MLNKKLIKLDHLKKKEHFYSFFKSSFQNLSLSNYLRSYFYTKLNNLVFNGGFFLFFNFRFFCFNRETSRHRLYPFYRISRFTLRELGNSRFLPGLKRR